MDNKIKSVFEEFKNIHKGQHCFVIGNAPSLNKYDLTKLKNELLFGCNRIYLLYPKIGKAVDYLFFMDLGILDQDLGNIDRILKEYNHKVIFSSTCPGLLRCNNKFTPMILIP